MCKECNLGLIQCHETNLSSSRVMETYVKRNISGLFRVNGISLMGCVMRDA